MNVSDVVYAYTYDGTTPKVYLETEDFQHVVSVDFGDGYSWDSLEAWYSPSRRRFFWLEGAGCSCNSLGDDVSSIADFAAGNRDELTAAVRRKYDETYSGGTGRASELLSDLARVKTFRASTNSEADRG